jgi:hypothetical protein
VASPRAPIACLLAALAIAACGGLPGAQGDPSAPVLVRGRVVDANGSAVAGAAIQLEVFDEAHAQVGQAIPDVFRQTYTSGLDGTFEIHLLPPADLAAFAKANSDYVNFSAIALTADGAFIGPFGFSRQIVLGSWAGAPQSFVVGPKGIQQPGNLVPVPLPAQT